MGQNRGVQPLRIRVIFLLASRLLLSTTFMYRLRGGDALVRHDALYGTDVCTGSRLQRCECPPI